MCSRPVTFGGGIGMTNGRRSPDATRVGSASKKPPSSQKRYHLGSTAAGSYAALDGAGGGTAAGRDTVDSGVMRERSGPARWALQGAAADDQP